MWADPLHQALGARFDWWKDVKRLRSSAKHCDECSNGCPECSHLAAEVAVMDADLSALHASVHSLEDGADDGVVMVTLVLLLLAFEFVPNTPILPESSMLHKRVGCQVMPSLLGQPTHHASCATVESSFFVGSP